MGWYGFSGGAQSKRVVNLSGGRRGSVGVLLSLADSFSTVDSHPPGERNRAFLAQQLKKNANVLILDEPTNDLDVSTLRSLEEARLSVR